MSRDDIKECLRERIEKAKQWNVSDFGEIQAKRAIIEPIFDCLDWDTSNPREVILEHTMSPEGRVDYAFLKGSDPVILVEAKAPNKPLEDHATQLLKYAFADCVELAVLTNGVEWWLYLPREGVKWDERKFYSIDLFNQPIDDICDKFVEFLSKGNVTSGAAVVNAKDMLSKSVRRSRIQKTLPIVWNDVITEPNEILVDLLIEETERKCGFKPDESQVKNFLKKPVKEISPIALPKIHKTKRTTDDKFILPIGLKLHKKYKGKKFTAVTVANNRIRLDLDGNIYTLNQGTRVCIQTISPHRPTENAWLWWKCVDPETGEEKFIKKLKKE